MDKESLDFFESMGITLALGVVQHALKNPDKAAAAKTVLLHLRDGINALYPGE